MKEFGIWFCYLYSRPSSLPCSRYSSILAEGWFFTRSDSDCRKRTYICDALRDLVQSVQFKKRGKRTWRSVTFSKIARFQPATLPKVTLLHGCFSRFLNCTNGTKSSKTSHIYLHFVDARVGENLGHAMFNVLASVDSTKNILIKLVMRSLCFLFFMFQLKGLSLSNSDVIKQVHNSFAR